jgi:hypothetical protein
MLHLCHEPEALLLRDQIISKVELLELSKVCVFVKHLSVECREFVSRKREPFKLRNLTQSLEEKGWIHERRA